MEAPAVKNVNCGRRQAQGETISVVGNAAITSIDISADIGEGSGFDGDLLNIVSSASIACGLHAGDPPTMIAAVRAASARGVAIGAHPSYADREGFGRNASRSQLGEISALLCYQIGAMAGICRLADAELSYVKLHGALYNDAAADPDVADAVLETVATGMFPGGHEAGELRKIPILCPSSSQLATRARSFGVEVFAEAFADRAYNADGTLVDRRLSGALIRDPAVVANRVTDILLDGTLRALDGSTIAVPADSICVHGDTPGTVNLARAVRRAAEAAGVDIRPFAPCSRPRPSRSRNQ